MTLDPRTPVLVGVGTAAGPPSGGAEPAAAEPAAAGAEPAELMARAVLAAAADAGAPRLLRAVDRIAVPQGTWRYPDPARLVAARIGATHARTLLAEVGVSQQTLVNLALQDLMAGRAEVAVVVGGEARRWARTPAAAETPQPGAAPDVTEAREPDFVAAPEMAAGIAFPPVQQYAMIEHALQHHERAGAGASAGGRSSGTGNRAGRRPTPDHGQRPGHGQRPAPDPRDEVADLWARCNTVAQGNPAAAFPEPRTAAEIATPGPDNRPLAHPYNKWHASQWTVDQAAALLLCTADAARRAGVPPDRWVFPLIALDANHAVSLSRRRLLHRWPAMGELGRAAAGRIGRPLAEIDVVEVYSCFPSAVRVQQRELGLPLDGTPTVTGGMAFAGGPFNNFVYQATAAVVPLLRSRPGSLGLVTTVCGMLTKPGLAVWSAEPDGEPPLVADLAGAAAHATPTVEVADGHRGPARVATYTVTYEGDVPARVAVVADVLDGSGGGAGNHRAGLRCVAVADDPALAAEAVRRDLIGETVAVDGTVFRP